MVKKIAAIIFALAFSIETEAQYISSIIEYTPAPGQFTNTPAWGTLTAAQSLIGSINGHLSLGAFGGYVIFKFENPVKNNPNNPFGVDFTIFGNPLQDMDNPNIVGWSEPGIVSVMKDENGNGLPDDKWYELAGSDYFFSSTIKNYSVTYENPNLPNAANVPWTDNHGNSGEVLANSYHTQPYYPIADSFPHINQTEYTLTGTKVADNLDMRKPSMIKSYKKAFGYVDNQFVGESPYTKPDNPYTNEKENAGGDAFDISWAVDENGNYIDLDEIHFIKVHNAVLADAGWLGEVSTEIRGAAVVEPNSSISGIMDMVVIKHLPDTIKDTTFQLEAFVFNNGRVNKNAIINWTVSSEIASIDANNILSFNTSGDIKITATWADNTSISASDSSFLKHPNSTYIDENYLEKVEVYPNPAADFVFVNGIDNFKVDIFDILSKNVMSEYIQDGSPINIQSLENGIYILQIQTKNTYKTFKLIKK